MLELGFINQKGSFFIFVSSVILLLSCVDATAKVYLIIGLGLFLGLG